MKKITFFLSALLISMMSFAGEVTVSIADYASANGWENSKQYTSLVMNEVVTVTANPTIGTYNNTGKYYTNGTNWRMYQNEKPEIIVKAAAGYVLTSVTVTYTIDKTGVLIDALGAQVASNTAYVLNNVASATFSVSNTGTATNGQVRITAIHVTYEAGEGGETPDPTPDPEEPEEPVVPEVPENLGAKTIAEFLELKNTTDTCVLTGVVANIANTTYGNFDLVDATGSVYVYGLLTAAGESKQFASMDIAAGDTLTVKAIYNEYNGNPQAKNAIYVSHTKAATPIVPENLGAKTIAEFLELKNTTDTCVLTGVVANIANTTYGNFDLVDATGSVYVYGLLTAAGESKQFASMDIAAGDTLTVKAIYNEYNSNPQAKNAIYVSHSKLVLTVEVTSENGTVDGLVDGGKYVRGTEATLTATAAEGYEFVNWTSGETEVSTENPYTFTVTVDVALVANFKEVEPAATWTVAGSPIFGANWDPAHTANDMTLQADGTYKWEQTEIELAANTKIEFKVVKNNAWGEEYPSSNYVLNIAEAGFYTITITFNAETKEVNAVATKTADSEIVVNYEYVLMGVAGDWETGIALTQNPENANVYMLIGQEILAGDAVKVVTLANGEKSAYCGNVEEWTTVAYDRDGDGNIVLAPGLYDFYYKVDADVIYIGGEAYPQVITHTIEGEVLEKNDGRYLTLVAEDETHGYIELNIFGYDGLSESYSISGAIDGVNVEGTCTYTVDEEAGIETLVASVVTDDATVKYEITLVYTIPAAQQYLIMMTEGIEAVSEVFEWEDVDEEGNPVPVRIAAYSWSGSNEEWEVYIEAGENIEGFYAMGSVANLATGQVAEISVLEEDPVIEEVMGQLSIYGLFTDGLNTYEVYLIGQLPVVEEEGTTKYITVENAEIAPGMDIVTDLEIWAEDEDYNTIMIALTEGTTKMYGDYTADELYISYNWETATLLEETVGTYKLDGEVAVFEATVLCGADTLVLSISGTPWVNPATIVPVDTVEMKFYEGTIGYKYGTTNIAGTNAEATLSIGIIGADESNMYDQEWSADDLSWNTTLTIADKEVAFIYGTVTIKKDGDDKVVTASLLGDDHVLYVITLTTGKELTTGLENLDTTVAPVKAIVNGQLVIIKNGVQYNATGAVVK